MFIQLGKKQISVLLFSWLMLQSFNCLSLQTPEIFFTLWERPKFAIDIQPVININLDSTQINQASSSYESGSYDAKVWSNNIKQKICLSAKSSHPTANGGEIEYKPTNVGGKNIIFKIPYQMIYVPCGVSAHPTAPTSQFPNLLGHTKMSIVPSPDLKSLKNTCYYEPGHMYFIFPNLNQEYQSGTLVRGRYTDHITLTASSPQSNGAC